MPVTTRSQVAAAAKNGRTKEAEHLPHKYASDGFEAAAAARRAVTRASRPPGKRKATKRGAAATASDAAAETAHISSLGDDLLLEIFLRLPSLATLIRAACACPAWRRLVASSPDFRRRFRALHPPPLLGLFSDMSTFMPARPNDDGDLAAAVRGGDFFLASLEYSPEEGPRWLIMDRSCPRGYVLLLNLEDLSLAVLNPLTRKSVRTTDLVSEIMLGWCHGNFLAILLSSEQDTLSFRVLLLNLSYVGNTMKAAVFSMETGVCSANPWVNLPARPELDDDDDDNNSLYVTIAQVNGFVYYHCKNWGYMVSLDTTVTMEFSIVELPLPQCLLSYGFHVGETKDGAVCVIYTDGLNVGVLMQARDANGGVEKLVLDKVVSMAAELERVLPGQFDECCALDVSVVRDGYAYLRTSQTLHGPDHGRGWFLSLCIETMKLEKLFQRSFDCSAFPYIMPWPRSLVGNYGKFALEVEGAPCSVASGMRKKNSRTKCTCIA